MLFKIVSKVGSSYMMDNVTEYHCQRMKESKCREELKNITNQQSNYWGEDSIEDQDILRFFITRSLGYSTGAGHDYRFEYHILREPACLYILNDNGKTIDRIHL